MQLLIKQRIFSWGDSYDVYDESEQPRYFVKGKVFSIGHQIHVYDKASGDEVGAIKQKIFSFLPRFEIIMNGCTVGTITREFSLLRPKYRVDFRDWEVDGDFMGWNYVANRQGFEVLRVSKEFFTWSDTYAIHYSNPADEIPGLLLVLAIDAVNSMKNDVDIDIDI